MADVADLVAQITVRLNDAQLTADVQRIVGELQAALGQLSEVQTGPGTGTSASTLAGQYRQAIEQAFTQLTPIFSQLGAEAGRDFAAQLVAALQGLESLPALSGLTGRLSQAIRQGGQELSQGTLSPGSGRIDEARVALENQALRARENQALRAQQIAASGIKVGEDGQYTQAQSDAKDKIDAAKLKAETDKELAAADEYARALADAAEAQASTNAAVLKILAASDSYALDLAEAKQHQAAINAEQDQLLAGTAAYAESLASGKAAQAQIAGSTEAILAGDAQYLAGRLKSATAQAQENAQIQQNLAGNEAYLQAKAQATAAQSQQNAQIQENLAANQGYIQSQTQAKVAQAQITAQQQELLAQNTGYIESLAAAKTAQAEISTRTQQLLTQTTGYAETLAQGKIAQAEINAAQNRILAGSNEYAAALAETKTSQAQIAAATQQQLVGNEEYISAQTQVATTRAQIAAEEQTALAGNQAYIQAVAEGAVSKRALSAAEKLATEQLLASRSLAPLARSVDVLGSEAAAAAATSENVAARKEETALIEREAGFQTAVNAAVEERVNAEIRKAEIAAQLLGLDSQELETKLLQLAEDRNLTAIIAQRSALEKELTAATAAGGAGAGGAGAGGAAAAGAAGGGGVDFGIGARNVLRYAVPSAVLFGAFRGITDSIKEAQQLEVVLNQIRSQLQSLGREGDFDQVSAGILRIARETGEASDQVASVQFQFEGAFGGNTQRAIRETQSAIELVRVTGLSLTETIDAFTALTENFRDSGTTIQDIGDKALGLQERFGVLAKQTISFAADLAPVGRQAGFTAQQLESIGAVAQKYSGASGQSLAEGFNRILPQLQDRGTQLLDIFAQIPQLASKVPSLAAQLGQGDIKGIFTTLLESFNSLSVAQQNYVLTQIGSRRETQDLVPVLTHGNELLAEFANTNNDAGKQAQYFGFQQQSLKQQLAEVGETLKQIGIQLYNSGLKDFFADLLRLVKDLADALGFVLEIATKVHDAIASLPGGEQLAQGGGNILSTVAEAAIIAKLGGLVGGIGQRLRGGGGTAVATGTGEGLTAGEEVGGAAAGGVALKGLAGLASRFVGGAQEGFGGAIGGLFSPVTAGLIAAIAVNKLKDTINQYNDAFDKADKSLRAQVDADLAKGQSPQDIINQAQAAGGDTFTGGGVFGSGVGPDVLPNIGDIALHVASAGQINVESVADRTKDETQRQAAPKLAGQLEALKQFGEYGGLSKETFNSLASAVQNKIELGLVDPENGQKPIDILLQFLKEQPENDQIQKEIQAIVQAAASNNGVAQQAISGAAPDASFGTPDLTQVGTIFQPAFGTLHNLVAASLRKTQEAANKASDFALSLADAKQGFEAGTIPLEQYKAQLEQEISTLKSEGADKPYAAKNIRDPYIADVKELENIQSTAVLNQAKLATELAGLGGQSVPQVQVAQYTTALQSGKLDRAGQITATRQVIDGLKSVLQQRVALAKTAEEQAKLLAEGIPIPQPVRIELIREYLDSSSTQFQNLEAVFNRNNLSSDALTQIITDAANRNVSIEIATRDWLVHQIFDLSKQYDALIKNNRYNSPALAAEAAGLEKGIIGSIDALKQLPNLSGLEVPDSAVPSSVTGSPQDIQQKQDTALQDAEKIQEARLEYLAALTKDPVKLAEIAQQKADAQYQLASQLGDEAGQLQALTARVQADHQLQDAIFAIQQSQLELAKAYADAAGDQIQSAQISLQEAQAELQHDIDTNAGDKAINEAKAKVVSSQAGVRDAQFNTQKSYYEFLHDVGQITDQQLVSYLQSLLASTDRTQQEREDLQREIYQLQHKLQSDFQFNLPTSLGLPTLYEARRTNQTGPTNLAGYNDNRTQTIIINAGSASAAEIAQQVETIVGDPRRLSTGTRRY